MDYYVSFRTEDKTQNITIEPSLYNYETLYRNTENYGNAISVVKEGSTILTSPKDSSMIFVHIDSCTDNTYISYDFKNAYNSSSLNIKGDITANSKNNFINIPNTKLDTELVLQTRSSSKIFVKHTGLNEKYQPVVNDIIITYDKDKTLTFTQPIINEEFKYTINLDKRGYLLKESYTLCSFTEMSKLAHYTVSLTSQNETNNITLDFSSSKLRGYEKFDVLILAEQTSKGKIMVLSKVFQGSKRESGSSNIVLVVVLVILAVLLISGAILAFILLRRYKQKPTREKLNAKETSLVMVNNQNEKMITSSATQNND